MKMQAVVLIAVVFAVLFLSEAKIDNKYDITKSKEVNEDPLIVESKLVEGDDDGDDDDNGEVRSQHIDEYTLKDDDREPWSHRRGRKPHWKKGSESSDSLSRSHHRGHRYGDDDNDDDSKMIGVRKHHDDESADDDENSMSEFRWKHRSGTRKNHHGDMHHGDMHHHARGHHKFDQTRHNMRLFDDDDDDDDNDDDDDDIDDDNSIEADDDNSLHRSQQTNHGQKVKADRDIERKVLTCKCDTCSPDQNLTCETDGACFVSIHARDGETRTLYGCFERKQLTPHGRPFICQTSLSTSVTCCYDDMCNALPENQPQLNKQGEKDDPCDGKCKKRHVCVVDGESGVPQCLHKKLLRQRARQAWKTDKLSWKHSKKESREARKESRETRKEGRESRKESRKAWKENREAQKKIRDSQKESREAYKLARNVKNEAADFQRKYEKKRHRQHHVKTAAPDVSTDQIQQPVYDINVYDVNDLPQKTAPQLPQTACSKKELADMGRRLLDWFKLLKDQEVDKHSISKRNSMKKELHEQNECLCQAPVRSEFLRLDKDEDDELSSAELDGLESNGYEHCIKPFIQTCDHDSDQHLSSREWCCCFADVLPPCLAEMSNIPATLNLGTPKVVLGAFVPQCDLDGFYKPVQCHGSTGYCWCVDRSGKTLEGSHTRGTPDCNNLDKMYNSKSPNLLDLE